MRIFELFEAGLTYRGYPCTKDCSGHQAGYNWAVAFDLDPNNCPYSNNSFWEGCISKDEPGDDQQDESLVQEKWSAKYKRSINCANPRGFSQRAHCQGRKKNESIAEGATVTRIDSKPITDFAYGLKTYKHTDDWSQSGLDTGDDSYWKNKKLKTNTTKGLFAGDPRRTALYATGNAHETRYVEFTQNGQPIVYFDKKDLPKIRNRKTYLSVFDASDFKQLPTGEWFSENPGNPIKQMPISDPFKYIASQGWIVRVTDDLDKVFKQVKKMYKAGKIAHYGAEGMNESKQGVAEGVPQPGKSSGKPISWIDRNKVVTKYLTLDEIFKSITGIPYYNNVVSDRDKKDFTWGVTKKVIEYAKELIIRPDAYKNWPPIIVVDGGLQDGAHRISTIYLMQQRVQPNNPIWKNAKLKVEFGTSDNVKKELAVGKSKEFVED